MVSSAKASQMSTSLIVVLSGPVDPVLAVLARHRVASLVVEEPNHEDAFLDLYGDRS